MRLKDLRAAGSVIRQLLSIDWYRDHIIKNHNGHQEVCHLHLCTYLTRFNTLMPSAYILTSAGNQLIESWNRELMSCVRDSYVRLVLEMFKIRRDSSTSTVESRATHAINLALNACGSQIYSFWPTSNGKPILCDTDDVHEEKP